MFLILIMTFLTTYVMFISAYAIRQCLPIGQWYSNPNNNKTWTNYTACTATKEVQRVPRLIQVITINVLVWLYIIYYINSPHSINTIVESLTMVDITNSNGF